MKAEELMYVWKKGKEGRKGGKEGEEGGNITYLHTRTWLA